MDSVLMNVIIWIVIFALLVIIEIATTNLVTIWFAISAFILAVLATFVHSIIIQMLIFIILSTILIVLTRPLVKNMRRKNNIKTNSASLEQQTAIASDDFLRNDRGVVKINGIEWMAISYKDDISKGDRVIVIKVDGAKLIVEKL